MSQPLLFFWRSRRRSSASTDLPKFHYLYFEVASVEDAFVFPHDLWISVSNSHSTGTIHAALTALHRKLSLSTPHGSRIVVHCGSDVLKRETERFLNLSPWQD